MNRDTGFPQVFSRKKFLSLQIFLCVLFVFVVKYGEMLRNAGRGSVWLERDVRDVEVGGSNPLAPTNFTERDPILYHEGGVISQSETADDRGLWGYRNQN